MNTNCCSPNSQDCGCSTTAESTVAKTPTYLPSVDVHQTADAIVITADVPGAKPDSVDVTFEDTTLTLRAAVARQTAPESRRALHREYGVGDYIRKFSITDPIDRDRIRAQLTDGVLTVTLPKAESARPRKIPVNASNN